MEMQTKTDNLMVVMGRSKIILFGLIGLSFLAFGIRVLFAGSWLLGPFFIAFSLVCFWPVQWSKLVIDKQAGTITVTRWTVLSPLTQKKLIPIDEVRYLFYFWIKGRGFGQLVSIKFYRKDAGFILFGWAKEHYRLIDELKLHGNAKSREEAIADEIAQFIGVKCYNTGNTDESHNQSPLNGV